MTHLVDLLFAGSDALFAPVLLGLLLLVVHTLVTAGVFAREALGRRGVAMRRAAQLAASGPTPGQRRRWLEGLELRLARFVDRDARASRLGPMFGLAGTLIPLGPGLRSLHQGDFGAFGQQLAVAFATTVAGLFVCAVCFTVSGVRGQWYEADLRDLERRLVAAEPGDG